mgnify:CR=1 FL=1
MRNKKGGKIRESEKQRSRETGKAEKRRSREAKKQKSKEAGKSRKAEKQGNIRFLKETKRAYVVPHLPGEGC